MDFILTMLDTAGIQPYVFSSNRLQENIGASELVYRATTLWAFAALSAVGLKHNVFNGERLDWSLDATRAIESDATLDAEVVYAGGGNTLIIFRTLDQAKQFTRELARQLLEAAPNLTLVVQHLPIQWYSADEEQRLPARRKTLLRNLTKHKQARLPSAPSLGLGVTAVCQSTGLVAVRTNEEFKLADDEETRLISSEIVAKLKARDEANERLEFVIGEQRLSKDDYRFKFPSDIDKLGRVLGEESYVAVVHADGNRMGRHLDAVFEGVDWTDPSTGNRECVQRLRHFSTRVNEACRGALQVVVDQVMQAVAWNKEDKHWSVADSIPLEKRYLPFRPLVFGGDDLTFLCNGQLGLALAETYLRAFEQKLEKMFACAGVAIVKMHYPFARAYALSEQLTNSAKRFVREEVKDDCSALDWHFATSGLSGALSAIRAREYQAALRTSKYQADVGNLLMRPIALRARPYDQTGRYWISGLEYIVREFEKGKAWKSHHNKVVGLRDELRKGPKAVAAYRKAYGLPELPLLLPGDSVARETGWSSDRCVYFDALELMDHYLPLAAVEVTA